MGKSYAMIPMDDYQALHRELKKLQKELYEAQCGVRARDELIEYLKERCNWSENGSESCGER